MSKHANQVNNLVTTIANELANETDLLAIVKDAGETIEALRAGMGTISAKRRQAIRGLHASGLSYQKIADRLGISKGGVVSIDKGKG